MSDPRKPEPPEGMAVVGGIYVPRHVAEEAKRSELARMRKLAEKAERRRRKAGTPMSCSVCGEGRTTLYQVPVIGGESDTETRCGKHR